MCGTLQMWAEANGVNCNPTWRTSRDGKHISFYASMDTCEEGGATNWCRNHCYIKLLPPPAGLCGMYERSAFLGDINSQPFKAEFEKASYVTFFASGAINAFTCDPEFVIREIPEAWPDKIFRFFVRKEIKFEEKESLPENARIIFSADCKTLLSNLTWAVTSKHVKGVSVVSHPANIRLLKMLKKMIPCISCSGCRSYDYKCFTEIKRKYLIKMDMQGEEVLR